MREDIQTAGRDTSPVSELREQLDSGSFSVGCAARPDADLMRLAQAGNTAAFDELVARYRDRVYTVVAAALADERKISDAVCEAFLHAWRGIARASAARADAWFYVSALRAILVVSRIDLPPAA
jgi:hypothetical protein